MPKQLQTWPLHINRYGSAAPMTTAGLLVPLQKSELEEDSDDYDDDVADQSSDDSDSVPSKKSRPDLSGDL